MKFWIKILSVFLFFSLIFLPKNTESRSGCCSHHGGVCGCRCCDGSSLSATCAPYYPSCGSSGSIEKVIQPTRAPTKVIPTKIPTSKPTLVPTLIPTKTEEISPTSTTQSQVLGETTTKPISFDNSMGVFLVLSGLGFGGYKLVKKFKK